jgi:hypothetical protein
MKTLAFQRGSGSGKDYLVLLHPPEQPSSEDWTAYVNAVARALAESTGRLHAFVATDGGAPSAPQRKELAAAFARGDALTHVFTTDAFIRGVVTAFRWVSRAGAVAHHPKEFDAVCRDCGFLPADVLSDFRHVQRQLPRVIALESIERSSLVHSDSARL